MIAARARPADPKALGNVRDTLFAMVRDDAKNKGNADPIEEVDYRDIKAWKIGDGIMEKDFMRLTCIR